MGNQVRGYEQLEVWRRSMDFVVMVYELTKDFPREERFGLTQQLQRAAVSVPSNLAEGRSRETTKDFLHFTVIARGSLAECVTQLQIAGRLGYHAQEYIEEAVDQATVLMKMINALRRSLLKKGSARIEQDDEDSLAGGPNG